MTGEVEKFLPTAEQLAALELFKSGNSLAIEAGAGTGKTSTLILLAESTKRRGRYIAFNRAIVKDAGSKFPRTVTCSTAHSLAFQAVGKPFLPRIEKSGRMKPLDVATVLGIKQGVAVTTFADEKKQIGAGFLASHALRTVLRYCQSADLKLEARHVPRIDGLDKPIHAQHGPLTFPINAAVAQMVLPFAKKAWDDIRRYDGALPFDHGHYLKMFHLSVPKIEADYVLFDEAQDANPVLQAIVLLQEHAQLVWVGDSQQSIYGFTGAVNALAAVPSDAKTYLTQSFRFGPAIAGVANAVLEKLNAELRLVGTPAIRSEVEISEPIEDPDVILTRTNAGAVREMFNAQANGKKVHLLGGSSEMARFMRAAKDLMNGKRTDHPQLACFASWDEVLAYIEEYDEDAADLKVSVKLIEDFEIDDIIKAVTTASQERHADVVISTAHKSKGREWNRVQIGGDFPSKEKVRGTGGEELRLLYVAATRAKILLDISLCATLCDTAPVPAHEQPVKRPVAKKPSEYVGQVDDSLECVLTVTNAIPFVGDYGAGLIVKMTDANGNAFKWVTNKEVEEGEVLQAMWKVKKHEEYRGVKETVLTRPLKLTVVETATLA